MIAHKVLSVMYATLNFAGKRADAADAANAAEEWRGSEPLLAVTTSLISPGHYAEASGGFLLAY